MLISGGVISVNFLFFLILNLLAWASHAEVAAQRSALIIGISEYGYSEASSLKGVEKDMESATRIALAMGIPKEKIHFIRNQEATKQNILQSIEKIADEQQNGRAFVYYSGHGTRSYDSVAKGCVEGLLSYEGQVITHAELASALKNLNETTDKVIVMLDACHSKGVLGSGKRSITSNGLTITPKFTMKNGDENVACAQPVNYRTRGLFNEVTRLGGIQENFVQIAAAREDEVSFDQPDAGGLATQGVRDCMLGRAKDIDHSGAVSLEEVRQCAQEHIERISHAANVQPHHITVKGNRNLIPVSIQKPIQSEGMPIGPEPVKESVTLASHNADDSTGQNSAASSVTIVMQTKPPELHKPQELLQLPDGENKVLASLATLKDIAAQRNPQRVVDVKLNHSSLKIGKDVLELQVRSNHSGYLYMILLGSDTKSFYVLYPNGLDQENRIQAGKFMTFPKPDWQIRANGPVGTDQLLVMVTDTPRRMDGLAMSAPTASEPFTYMLNNLDGRSALIDFLVGSGVGGRSESFGAKIVSIREIK